MFAEPSMPGKPPSVACFTVRWRCDETGERSITFFLITERRPSPGLSINFSSNNPFRRAVSPAQNSPALSPALNSPASQHRSSSGSRPMSRNPFLSTFEAEFNKEARKTDLIDMSADMKDSPKKATFGTATEELFVRPHFLPPARERQSLAARRTSGTCGTCSAARLQHASAQTTCHRLSLAPAHGALGRHGAIQAIRASIC
jgi:hypothetical protein